MRNGGWSAIGIEDAPGARPFYPYSLVSPKVHGMNVIELTRALIDIESITNNEERVALYIRDWLRGLAARYGGHVETMEVEPRRFNLFAQFGERLDVTLSTHLDTVPPFVASREDETFIWGRGSCDAKGIIAAMIHAAQVLLESGERHFGILLVVGEERNSAGALQAARSPRGSRSGSGRRSRSSTTASGRSR